jgi:hypothetical protein
VGTRVLGRRVGVSRGGACVEGRTLLNVQDRSTPNAHRMGLYARNKGSWGRGKPYGFTAYRYRIRTIKVRPLDAVYFLAAHPTLTRLISA